MQESGSLKKDIAMSRTDKLREKRRLARMAKSQKMKEQLEIEEAQDDAPDEFEEVEIETKDAGEVYMPMPTATSFTELDEYRIMQERAEKVEEVSWDVKMLINNILYSSDLMPNEKADAIKKVGSEFGARVQNAISEDVSQMSKSNDMDLLVIKSMLATDSRHESAGEKLLDWISKKKLTAAAENKLSDEDFALVYTDKSGKKVRKYPIHDKAHVRSALSYAAKLIDSGGTGAEDARKALPKIHAAAKKMGIGMASKSALVIEKAMDGNWRMVGFPTNNFIDWHGDIIAEKAHLEYVDWVDRNKDCSPLFLSWHVPGTQREQPVDFVGYENGFLIASAPLTEDEAAGLLKAQMVCGLGGGR